MRVTHNGRVMGRLRTKIRFSLDAVEHRKSIESKVNWAKPKCEVLQGTKMSPVFYNVMIEDVYLYLPAYTFADTFYMKKDACRNHFRRQ